MSIYYIAYALRQVYVSLRRNIGLTLITSIMISVSLMAVGGFALLGLNLEQIFTNVESSMEISVFLTADADIGYIKDKINRHPNIYSYEFISREQGLADFGNAIGNPQILSDLTGENNPLPDVFRIKSTSVDAVPGLADEISSYQGIEMVEYGRETLIRIITITDWIRTFIAITSIILATGAVFLIVTIIRMSILSRQEEIGIMKYLGASNWFVRFPYVLGGVILGWIGTIIAVLLIGYGYYRIIESLGTDAFIFLFQPVTDPTKIVPVFINMMLLGTLVGGLGSFISVRKFLRV